MSTGEHRPSSNIRVMQLFHELKQRFPTVPDHVVSACISEHSANNTVEILRNAEAPRAQPYPIALMGKKILDPSNDVNSLTSMPEDMSNGLVNTETVFYSKKDEKVSCCTTTKSAGNSTFFIKRPDTLNIRPTSSQKNFNDIKPSERVTSDLDKLLLSETPNKPPRSPGSSKRKIRKGEPVSPLAQPASPSPTDSVICNNEQVNVKKRETAETPTQTEEVASGSVNLSLNVNCSMDLVQSPTRPRHSSVLQVTPQQPWCQEPSSPRSYTSVNLTLRPPTSDPQPPIDICSANSSLTYSTSSFDSQNGFQSRLQITVGPGGAGAVSAVRTRPRSCCYLSEDVVGAYCPVVERAGSMSHLTQLDKPPVVLKQQARIERLKIELVTEKTRLSAIQSEVASLKASTNHLVSTEQEERDKETQLKMKIKHVLGQCERLFQEVDRRHDANHRVLPLQDSEGFYGSRLYTGQRGPIQLPDTPSVVPPNSSSIEPPVSLPEGDLWPCHMCTFRNHPLLQKCEQCDMPRILYGRKTEPPNPCLSLNMLGAKVQT